MRSILSTRSQPTLAGCILECTWRAGNRHPFTGSAGSGPLSGHRRLWSDGCPQPGSSRWPGHRPCRHRTGMTRPAHPRSATAAVGLLIALLWFTAAPDASAMALRAGPTAPPAARWAWPLAPAPADVLRLFDDPERYGPGHRGVDLRAEPGDPVFAVDAGIVRFSGMVAGRPVLSIQHNTGLISTYEPVESALAAGTAVAQGQQVGSVSTVIRHEPDGGLHLGARLGDDYIDPLALLGAVPRAVLLPLRG